MVSNPVKNATNWPSTSTPVALTLTAEGSPPVNGDAIVSAGKARTGRTGLDSGQLVMNCAARVKTTSRERGVSKEVDQGF